MALPPLNLPRSPGDPWSVLDARGRRVALFDAFGSSRTAAPAFQLTPAEVKALRTESSRHSRAARWTGAVLVVVLAILTIVQGLFFFSRGNVLLAAFLGLVFAASAAAIAEIIRFSANSDPLLFRGAMLRRKRCPSCAFELRDIPGDADGYTICPECGAAWQLLPEDHRPGHRVRD